MQLSTRMLKLIAMLTMLVDHIGLLFFPEDVAFRIVGRIAMPLFAYGIAQGYWYTRQHGTTNRYLCRIAVLFLISQIPYNLVQYQAGLALNFNICASWVLGITALTILDSRLHYILKTLLLILLIVAITGTWLDYSFLAVSLVVAFSLKFRCQKGPDIALCFAGALVILFSLLYSNYIELCALAAIPILLVVGKNQAGRRPDFRIPKWVGYAFYPLHLILLSALSIIF